jgi:hypothetical protein
MKYSRRAFGITVAALPFAKALPVKRIDSKFSGVQIGAVTYSFNRIASPRPGSRQVDPR